MGLCCSFCSGVRTTFLRPFHEHERKGHGFQPCRNGPPKPPALAAEGTTRGADFVGGAVRHLASDARILNCNVAVSEAGSEPGSPACAVFA
jgi:hypothetical protein